MSGEKDLEQLKREAAAKAKAAAIAKRQARAAGKPEPSNTPSKPVAPPQQVETQKISSAGSSDELAEKKATTERNQPQTPTNAQESSTESINVQEPRATTTTSTDAGDDLAKQKAAAVAKAKAAAAAKRKAMELAKGTPTTDTDNAPVTDDAKAKAAAAAKAKAAAAAKAKAAAAAKAKAAGTSTDAADDEKAKAIAAAKAKAKAAAAAKSKAGTSGTPTETTQAAPSPNQPFLDKYRKVIEENLGSDVLEDSYINKLSKDVPTLIVKREAYFKLAQFLKYNELLGFDYLSELHGTDFETHMEVYVHFYSYRNRQSVALKVKIDRDEPTIESLQPLWAGANWPECEAFDLLGIKFTGHPDLHRIMLGEDWVGYPLRKDYEPYDVEV